MKRSGLLAFMLFWGIMIIGQNIQITFTGTGESTVVDSVTATNFNTNKSITLPGNATLILGTSSGIDDLDNYVSGMKLFPNPTHGKATLLFNQTEPGDVKISIRNMLGQEVYQSNNYLNHGQHSFSLSLNKPGIYMIILISGSTKSSIKAICTEGYFDSNSILLTGNSTSATDLKSQQNTYFLVYSDDQVMHFKCHSDKHITIFPDSPDESQNYEVEFVDCTDPKGRTYEIIGIGSQMWMAENLAYLPAINNSDDISDVDPFYYVYGYDGTSVSSAENVRNYDKYGVLYNWEAAKITCPSGWHLPSNEEWIVLKDYLMNNGFGDRGFSDQIGKSMASTSDWSWSSRSGDVGYYRDRNNSSGFNALPGGYFEVLFEGDKTSANFWSSSPNESYAMCSKLYFISPWLTRFPRPRHAGLSVRCVKDE